MTAMMRGRGVHLRRYIETLFTAPAEGKGIAT